LTEVNERSTEGYSHVAEPEDGSASFTPPGSLQDLKVKNSYPVSPFAIIFIGFDRGANISL